MNDLGTMLRQEREALVADLQGMEDGLWATPSLCAGWTVQDVLAHMTALARMTPLRFFRKIVANGFSLHRLQAHDIAVEKGASGEETLVRFRSVTARKNGLPGQAGTILGETLLHSEDIRRPLGIRHAYPLDALVSVADHYKRTNLIAGSKRRIAGLTLQATDVDWSAGSGPVVVGPMLSLLMAMAGRRAGIDDLEGEGVTTLQLRS